MSLHKFAEQVAANGRGDDSLLVHMTPDEVRNLQKFAEANGTTLTLNPHTGLPEAGLLSDLFKAVAPIALGAFLGPAGFGLSATMAGVATGGITALATGSLSRGLMAGLGAYGGAGLGESFMTAGGGMSAANAASAAQGQLGATNLALGEAMPAQAAEQFTKDAVARMTPSGAVSAGLDKAIANPMDFAKENYKPLLAAAAPIMAGAMVPTTTKFPEAKSTGNIRQMAFNINPDTGKPDPLYGVREMTPVKASEWGDKTFQGQRDLFYSQNQNPYALGVGSLNQPPQQPARMNTGGIVALAGGGVPGYAGNDGSLVGGNLDTANPIYQYFAKPETQALLSSGNDKAIADALVANKWSLADVANATGTQDKLGDYTTRFVKAEASPTTDTSEFMTAANAVGLQNQALADAMQNAGMSAAAQYASTHALSDAGGIGGTTNGVTDPNGYLKSLGYTTGALPGDQGGLEGLYANINYGASGLQKLIDSGQMTVAQAQNAALAEMQRSGTSLADVRSATGKSFGDLFTPKKEEKKTTVVTGTGTGTGVTPGGGLMPGGFTYDNGAISNYGNNTGNPLTRTPGDIINNPDGTVTVVPNIPGRPYGGFPGIQAVKDSYTAGGGSLGYTAKAPKNIAEFNQLYNKQTGDSLAAYNYLMGKGANNNAYPVKSGVSQIAVPYNEFVLGKKTTRPTATTTKTTTVAGVPGQPQTYFDEAAYLAANPDVAAELKSGKAKFANAYEHYLMYGQKEGRKFTGDYQGYLTAAALANATQQGGESPSGPSGNTGNTISGFNPAAPNPSVTEGFMGIGEGNDGNTGSTTGTEGGNVASAKGGLLPRHMALGGLGSLGSYSDGGRLLKGPGDGVSDSIPATIGNKQQPARLADGEFVVPARIVSELGNGSTEAGAKKLYAMMDRVQRARGKTTGKNKVAANSRADKYLPA